MNQRLRILVLCMIFASLPLTLAQVSTDETSATEESEQLEEASAVPKASGYDEEIEVRARRPDLELAPLDLEVLESGRTPNIAVALGTFAGLSGVRRSLGSYEPVARGLSWERVQTELDGMPLYGACPARMDPPAFLLAAASAERVSVVKGGTEKIDYSVGLEAFEQGDYESADGTQVPSSQAERGGILSFGHRPGRAHRWSVGTMYQEGEETDYPSLPMDTDRSESAFDRAGYRYEPERRNGPVSSLEVGVENLFDRQYVAHLTREAAGNVPGLDPGQEIPQPGRCFNVALRGDF